MYLKMESLVVKQINRTRTRHRGTQDQKRKMCHLKLQVSLLFYHKPIQSMVIYQLIEVKNV